MDNTNLFIRPMLLHKAPNNEPLQSKDYINEVKLDGIRLVACFYNRKRFFTRHGVD
ncbi:hypothetical protein BpOF4_20044 (plasmid) [Alkalihalophilus pseudofirmus OF4]|uniref:ATP-dependent DNA ligase n=1 Tax=Alkalihalophilus pseudofirmus (strain ATCC BAA-2126 / JCM 17055 / OF4) TaxID=398511 RepID=D3G0Y2_ALKPO|nr:hypothetical protein BpOF4_20044 [Alkalihalophilus pseudofirmus OF4]